MRPRGQPEGSGARLLCALDDDLTTAVVAALRADTVIHHGGAAVRAYAQRGNGSKVVRATLVSSLLGEFVFRMCHNVYSLFVHYSFKSPFRAANGLFVSPASSFTGS